MKEDTWMAHMKEHYKYNEWRGQNTLPESLFIWKFFLSGNEFPSWTSHKIKRKELKGWPPSIKSLWRQQKGEKEALLSVNVFECNSRDAAHEFLLQFLGEFQSPLMAISKVLPVGDVAFASPPGASIVAARANLVFQIARVDRDVQPVGETASEFDEDLIRKEPKEEVKVLPDFVRFEARLKEPQVDVPLPLEVEALDPLKRPLWYKFFSASGEVRLEQGQLIYRPAKAGLQGITAFAINENGSLTQRTLELDVA